MTRSFLLLLGVGVAMIASACDTTQAPDLPDPDPEILPYEPVPLAGAITYLRLDAGADDTDTVLARMDLETGATSTLNLESIPAPYFCGQRYFNQARFSLDGNRLVSSFSCTNIVAEEYLVASDADLLAPKIVRGGVGRIYRGAMWAPDNRRFLYKEGNRTYHLYYTEIGPDNSMMQPEACVTCLLPEAPVRGWTWSETSSHAIVAFNTAHTDSLPSLDVYRVRISPLRLEAKLNEEGIPAYGLAISNRGHRATFHRITQNPTQSSLILVDIQTGKEQQISSPIPTGLSQQSLSHVWANDGRHVLIWVRLRTRDRQDRHVVGIVDTDDPELRWTSIEGVSPNRSISLEIRSVAS